MILTNFSVLYIIALITMMPDFAQVYSFLGSIFDPSTSGHLQKLREMNPINVETVSLCCYDN
jgi:hypothetical protein